MHGEKDSADGPRTAPAHHCAKSTADLTPTVVRVEMPKLVSTAVNKAWRIDRPDKYFPNDQLDSAKVGQKTFPTINFNLKYQRVGLW